MIYSFLASRFDYKIKLSVTLHDAAVAADADDDDGMC